MIDLPPEDIYATTKKIKFILAELRDLESKLGRPARILDFGCGNAEQLGQFIVGSGREYYGVDMHQPSLEHARSICSAKDVFFTTVLPEEVEFDVVIVSEVLEHLDEPVDILSHLVTHLASGGIVLGSIPNGYGLTEIEKYIIHKTGIYTITRKMYRLIKKLLGKAVNEPLVQGEIPYNHASGHVQFYTTKSISRVLEDSGVTLRKFQNGSVMGADLSGSTFLRGRFLVNLNTKAADYLPRFAAATWHFSAAPIQKKSL